MAAEHASQWWFEVDEPPVDWLMRHAFSGDPWGLCARCQHPAYHEIHTPASDQPAEQAVSEEGS